MAILRAVKFISFGSYRNVWPFSAAEQNGSIATNDRDRIEYMISFRILSSIETFVRKTPIIIQNMAVREKEICRVITEILKLAYQFEPVFSKIMVFGGFFNTRQKNSLLDNWGLELYRYYKIPGIGRF